MATMAQHVNPLSITIAEINLDSLRNAYLAQPTMYRASLEVVAEQLEQNAQQIKSATQELKQEQAHGKEIARATKEANKNLTAILKQYDKEETEKNALLVMIEQQKKKLGRQDKLNSQTADYYVKMINEQQQILEQSVKDLKIRKQQVEQLLEAWQTLQLKYQTYNQEIEKKAFDLAQTEVLLKERMKILKEEQKAAKSL
jgi:molecular chaperone DnaK (HSP70)